MVSPKRAQVVMIDLGKVPNQVVGHEQANLRPCVVIQTLDYAQLAVIVPFTSQSLSEQIYSIVKIPKNAGGLTSDSFALCHQIRSVSYKRIVRSMGHLSDKDFNRIAIVLDDFLDI